NTDGDKPLGSDNYLAFPFDPALGGRAVYAGRPFDPADGQCFHGQYAAAALGRIGFDLVVNRHGQASRGLTATIEIQIGGPVVPGVQQRDMDAVLELVALLPEQAIVEALSTHDHIP